MAKSIPAYLKLHDENLLREAKANRDDSAVTIDLCRSFAAATGWPLALTAPGAEAEPRELPDAMCTAPVNPGVGIPPGHIRLGFDQRDANADGGGQSGQPACRTEPPPVAVPAASPSSFDRAASAHCSPESANQLAAAICHLFGELSDARRIIRHRDAELAAGVPVIARGEQSELLAQMLESVLRAGAEACECQAAALYMLDDATTSLKLRSSIGLPVERLLQPPRPLKGAVADLEALLGHAVALERASAFGPWQVPEEFAAALCVPVSSPTIPLGTLWFFSDHPRDFTDQQTNLAEIIAGRLAAELERAMLLAEVRK